MEYIDFNRQGRIQRVHCLACVQVIVKRTWRGKLVRTMHYAELVLEMREPDGNLSKHETGMCKRCLRRLWQHGPMPNELAQLYARDVAQEIATALRAGWPPADIARRGASMAAREPLRVLHERGRGER